MKIAILSDLHTEFRPYPYGLPDADVLVLAGDVGVGRDATRTVNWFARSYEHVIYVLGNHEFYHGDIINTSLEIENALAPNVHLLDNSSVRIGDHRFHGATLWTDLTDATSAQTAERCMNDFRLIRDGESVFSAAAATALHRTSVQYLAEHVAPRDIVVTHHGCTPTSVHPRFLQGRSASLNAAFVTDLTDLIETTRPSLWIHGHVHDHFTYRHDGTLVVANPLGYPRESCNGFNPDLVLAI